ncbi:AAA family ATPase [Rhizobium viscosum]|uniref:Rad50/SbcC-type AAA domain-containing protein n=1 Tax=Rhizobium viscosum TaxID=1673 RepID=A0ABR9IV51_RHIVS|nr:AAA family ATPase [Rhizobium viscosum]MBE1507010.1 hypothetical protein [Rhizobium viscosum]
MNDQSEPVRLEDYNLDEIIQLLSDGIPIHRTKEPAFRLDTEDRRKAFAFYGRNRDLWPRNKTVQAKEIESLIKALEGPPPNSASPKIAVKGSDKPIWHLKQVEAHRFGGLHKHLGPLGEDPEAFILDLGKEITLVSGFNGAGKTALLSAIMWCLTGKALRSQHVPHEVHEPMTVEWLIEEDQEQESDGRPDIEIPPIVPIPSSENLAQLGDSPKLDTRVSLLFERAETGEVCRITRSLSITGKKLVAPVVGLESLGLSALALEAGTLMPGVAAHMRFDEKSDFTQAVSQLTGLRPLEELGYRTDRLVNRLRTTEKRTTEEAQSTKKEAFKQTLKMFQDRWEEQRDLGELPKILLPGQNETIVSQEAEEDEKVEQNDPVTQNIDCQSSIAAAQTKLRELRSDLSASMETILEQRIELATKQDVDTFNRALDDAADQLQGSSLRELPSVVFLTGLSKITDEEATSALSAIQDIIKRGEALSQRLEDERQAIRWRLYARVAAWHKDHHPDKDLVNCPVCGTNLDEVPLDALLDRSVKSALDQCREADNDIGKTAAQWESDEASAFLNVLPDTLRAFADKAPQDGLLDIYRKAYVDELLASRAFSGKLQPLRKNGQIVWDIACRENPLPDAPEPADSTLPNLLSTGKLQKRLKAVARTLQLRGHRTQAKTALPALVDRFIGKIKSADDATEIGGHGTETISGSFVNAPETMPLREQIAAIRRAVQNAIPIVSLIRHLDDMELIRLQWEADKNRLSLLARAADAVEPFLEYPAVVHERVSGLIETLNTNTAEWLDRIYRSHYRGGPSYGGLKSGEEGGFGLRAEFGQMHVPAHQVMNASLLRACVWAFLFAFWEHVSKQLGGLSCMLLDDPQTHFDPINGENLAAAIPLMPKHGMRPLITSNDIRFVAAIQDKLPSRAAGSPSWTTLRLNPVSSSKLTASLSSSLEEIREKRDRWYEDENDVPKAQDFVKCVRVDIENRLWNLLATDPLVMHDPTLADLLGQLRHARNGGEKPFEEPPFERLIAHEALRNAALFYKVINKAHHRPFEITPQDAHDVNSAYENVHSVLRSCTASYARFMGRLTNDERDLLLVDAPVTPDSISMPTEKIPVIGKLAARSSSDIVAVEEDREFISLDTLGAIALYGVRGPTLGSIALAGQVVMVSLDREPIEGEPVIALYKNRIFARRFHRDKKDPSKTVLAADRSGTDRVPPVEIVSTAVTRVMPIVGVLFEALRFAGQEEALPVNSSDILSRRLMLARIVEDSAYPIVRDGDMVIIESVGDTSPAAMGKLEGRIVAVTARSGSESFGYLKRVGSEIYDGARIYENIGLNGQAVCITAGSTASRGLILERLWRVHGVLRLPPAKR